MARNLEQLQKQYSRAPKDGPRGGMPIGPRRGGGPGGPRPKGKPKNVKASVKRLWSYVSAYRFRLILVLLCMLLATCSSLCGGYLLAPIINKITLAVKPNADVEYSVLERMADGIVSRFTDPVSAFFGGDTLGEVMSYILAALIILGSIYLIGIVCTIVLNMGIMVLYLPLGIILPFIITISLCMFMGCYASWPKIKEIMIDPYYDENGNPISQ